MDFQEVFTIFISITQFIYILKDIFYQLKYNQHEINH